jgi:prepilin peptidase dependent protein B
MNMRHRTGKRSQGGFTITELMITVGLSMSVISSVLIGYLATYSSSMDTLAASKLNQDMSALMNLMVNEMRRAGYSGVVPDPPTANAFATNGTTALTVFNNVTSNTQQSGTGSGSCVVYSYDMDEDGVVDAVELGGFRLSATGIVQMRTSGDTATPNTCASTTNNVWSDLTDLDFLTVTALTFNLANSNCLNTREPDLTNNDGDASTDEADEYNCYTSVPTVGSGNITVETREITITLTANLTNDTFVRMTQSQNVRVRNDLVRVR